MIIIQFIFNVYQIVYQIKWFQELSKVRVGWKKTKMNKKERLFTPADTLE